MKMKQKIISTQYYLDACVSDAQLSASIYNNYLIEYWEYKVSGDAVIKHREKQNGNKSSSR